MPESMTTNNARGGGSTVVQQFYEAVGKGDAEAVAALIDAHFASDVRLVLPASLSYGGIHEGVSRLRKMFTGMASAPGAGGPGELALVDTIDDGDKVVAHLEFRWSAPGTSESIPQEALEMWTFAQDEVTEIRGFYWDTHACVAQAAATL